MQKIKRSLYTLFAVMLVFFALAFAVLQFYVFPQINQYKDQIAKRISANLHQAVTIRSIAVGWHALSPAITLSDITLYDSAGRPALNLSKVKTRLSWTSVALLSPTLVSLSIDRPNLVVRRNHNGEVFLAGISMASQGNPAFANWLLTQRRIAISHATVTWIDEVRQAPALVLNDLNAELLTPIWQRILGRHSLHLDSLVSNGTRQRIALDAVLVGHDVAKPDNWHGELTLKLPDTQLAAWRPWLDLPVRIYQGQGSLQANLAFEASALQRLSANVRLQHVALSPTAEGQHFLAPLIHGEVHWQREKSNMRLQLKHFSAQIHPGVTVEDANGEVTWNAKQHTGQLSIKKIALSQTPALADWLPAQHAWIAPLQHMAAQGIAQQVNTTWKYQDQHWQQYQLDADLSHVQSQAYAKLPGLTNWSGQLHIKPNQGSLVLDTQKASIDTAGLLRAPVPIDRLHGTIRWEDNGQKTLISAKNLSFENPHLGLMLNAEYQLGAEGGDYLQLNSQLLRADAKHARNYYPNMMGVDTLHWLDNSILGGQIHHGEVVIKGHLKDFPFVDQRQQPDPSLGLFRVTAHLQEATLYYGIGWPPISHIDAALKFEGNRMDIEVKDGLTVGQRIVKAHVDIPHLDADWPLLNIKASAKSTVEHAIQFVNTSPIKSLTQGFTDHLKGAGEAELSLQIQIPLQNVDATTLQGDYAIKNGSLLADANLGLPGMQQINGHLKFNEKGIQAQNVQLQLFDNPAQVSLSTRSDKTVMIQGSGRMTHTALKKMDNNLLTRALNGTTDWKASLLIQAPLVRLDIHSQLVGMAVNLPAPLNKSADMPADFHIRLRQDQPQQDKLAIHYADWLHANLIREHEGAVSRISAGEISLNTPPRTPTEGLNIHADFAKLDLDAWLEYLKGQSSADHPTTATTLLPAAYTAEVSANLLHVFDRDLQQVKFLLNPSANRLHLNVQSPALSGEADWLMNKQNKLIAKLDYLKIPKSTTQDAPQSAEIRRSSTVYPELEINAKEFQWGEKALGSLELKAYNSGENWVIQRMALTNADSQLVGDGVWHNAVRGPQTLFKFNLSANHLGKSLQRFQLGELIKEGSGVMSGQISWPGSPHEFAVERLDGSFNLQLEKGQILKVQPGVGRLLGLLSLQSLPRRLTLDFRDLFSEGFAFDRIQCTANMRDGVLRSDDFFMTGPAAEVKIKGETNLKAETQRLKIKVVPHISDSVSLAALAGGPIIGVAAFIAQKLLKDPLNKITASEYMITGTWDAPQEVDATKPAATSPASGKR